MKVRELTKLLEGYEDFEIKLTVHRELSEDELKGMSYPYPFENIKTTLELDDIGHSDKIICFGCTIR